MKYWEGVIFLCLLVARRNALSTIYLLQTQDVSSCYEQHTSSRAVRRSHHVWYWGGRLAEPHRVSPLLPQRIIIMKCNVLPSMLRELRRKYRAQYSDRRNLAENTSSQRGQINKVTKVWWWFGGRKPVLHVCWVVRLKLLVLFDVAIVYPQFRMTYKSIIKECVDR